MNPYAAQLGDRDALDVITKTPGELTKLVESLGPAGLERSLAPGKWSARTILCHLADTEMVFAFRLRQTLAEAHYVVQPFDQDAWARSYAAYDASAALAAFTSVRRWNVAFVKNLPPEVYSKPLTHPERGPMTFKVLLETMAGHDLNHLRQFAQLSARQD
ncbi:MAG TPA: DinB family protein [Terriglobales bacterium]|nr:DinB family protein [Terriglobales bacterium]